MTEIHDRPDPQVGIQATVEMSRPRGALLPIQGFTLRVTSGPDSGAIFTSQGERTVVGTHETASFRLGDKAVSRFHCEVTTGGEGGLVKVKDLGSLNGLFVDGVKIEAGYLHPGAVLTVGQNRVTFELDEKPLQVPVSSSERFGIMVGRSVAMRRAFSLLERAAASSATVLLGGETGTGKEAAAESIHRESTRGDGPFIVIDCGAIPANLLETELFGHE